MRLMVDIEGESFEAEVFEGGGMFNVRIRNNDHEVEVSGGSVTIDGDRYDASLTQEGNGFMLEVGEEKIHMSMREIKDEKTRSFVEGSVVSAMPGKILSVHVKPGDNVEAGQVLGILEAMKMENEIISPKSGKVLKVNIKKGGNVGAKEELIVIG